MQKEPFILSTTLPENNRQTFQLRQNSSQQLGNFINQMQPKRKPVDDSKLKNVTPKKKSKREEFDDDSVSNVNFFKEDLEALDDAKNDATEMYEEIHTIFKQITGGPYMPSKNLRDIAALSETMVSARKHEADIVSKRISLKKTIADLAFRNNGGMDETTQEALVNQARTIVNLVRNEQLKEVSEVSTPKALPSSLNAKEDEKELLERELQKRLKSGKIVMNKNDKLVGTNDHVVTRYDKSSRKFVAVDSRNGKIIKNFPEDRLPQEKPASTNKDSVSLTDGEQIKFFNSLEFDNDYEDNEP